jgi:hypothetical protein
MADDFGSSSQQGAKELPPRRSKRARTESLAAAAPTREPQLFEVPWTPGDAGDKEGLVAALHRLVVPLGSEWVGDWGSDSGTSSCGLFALRLNGRPPDKVIMGTSWFPYGDQNEGFTTVRDAELEEVVERCFVAEHEAGAEAEQRIAALRRRAVALLAGATGDPFTLCVGHDSHAYACGVGAVVAGDFAVGLCCSYVVWT